MHYIGNHSFDCISPDTSPIEYHRTLLSIDALGNTASVRWRASEMAYFGDTVPLRWRQICREKPISACPKRLPMAA
jgi:hypothetical protein